MATKHQEHGPGLARLRANTTKLLNRPFQGVKNIVTNIGKGTGPMRRGGARLMNVFAAPMDFSSEAASYKPPVHEKSEREQEFLFEALKQNFVFADLSSQDLMPLVHAMEKFECPQGEVIIEQGELGDYFYVIASGSCKITIDGKSVAKMTKGDSFGELALMYSCPRAATVTATDKTVTLFRVDQKTFRMIYQAQVHAAELNKRDRLDSVGFLASLSEIDKQKLVDHMTVRTFKKGDLLMTKGAQADLFWMLEEGQLKMYDITVGDKTLADIKIEPGDHFGEQALLRGTPLFCNTVAETHGRAFVIDKESFISAVGDMEAAAARSIGRKGLSAVKVFHDTRLNSKMLDSLAKYVKPIFFKNGDVIMSVGEYTEACLYFVRQGKVHLKSVTQDTVMDNFGMFGEELLLLDAKRGRNSPRDSTQVQAPYTVTATSDQVILGVLSLKDCRQVFDTIYMGKGLPVKEDSAILNPELTVEDFTRHTILGAGTFGQVWLVSRQTSDDKQRVYALKIQSKYELVKSHQAKGVVHEKQIMTELHHPLVGSLVAAFKDNDFVYMLMELIQGGELETIMHNEKSDVLTEKDARFYAAGIAEGLCYMHRNGFVYRDLKPQNVMISNEGYPILIDFGFAKHVSVKTFTFCGTPLYLAPEIILNRGHNWAVDHWSLGIMIYEMLLGYTPFYEEHMDQMELFRAIVQDKLHLPRSMSSEVRSIIFGFLEKNPRRRLGSLAHGLEDIFDHAWFKEIDFAKLRHKEITPPFVPKVKDPLDASNFEDWSSMEDKMATHYPKLKASEAKIFDKF